MKKCPVTQLRSWLEKPIGALAKLPVVRGFPVPWFVAWIKGVPEFRAMDHNKLKKAVAKRLCWCCGEPLGYYATFVIGPMCSINRVSSEPPNHRECAQWSARNCPFLTSRQLERREDETTEKMRPAGGFGIKRNPGVTLLWTTDKWKVFGDGNGGQLIELGEPKDVEWFSHGRKATRAEVIESIESGIHHLENAARQEGAAALIDLAAAKKASEQFLPAE